MDTGFDSPGFDGLFTIWIRKINTKDLGNIRSGMLTVNFIMVHTLYLGDSDIQIMLISLISMID